MQKLKEVEDAKAIMTQGVNWSVMKWLTEKKKVRKAADVANAALDNLDRSVKATWNDQLCHAYEQLCQPNGGKQDSLPDEVWQLAKRVKHADDEALRAHNVAEDTFDEAERQLSTTMARDGCHKAILSWELREKAIQLAENGVHSAKVKV